MGTTIRVIIADDQRLFRQALKLLLTDFEIDVIAEAEHGRQLFDLLKNTEPDLILLDIEMPVMNGSETIEELSKKYPGLKVIILSTYYNETLVQNYMARGASAYLAKNTDIHEIVRAIRSVKMHGHYSESIPKASRHFTRRETEIIPLICEGKTNKEIARELHVVVKTVEAHRYRLYQKTEAKSIVEFLHYSFKKGLNFLKYPFC